STFRIDHIITGGVLAVILAFVILGGIRRIAAVTEKLVPFMAFAYFFGALLVIGYNAENIVPSVTAMFGDVFTGSAATGGFLGATIAFAFNRGVNRGLFSNEAGQGSAPIAHAAAKAHEPVSEGMVAILEPFIDTIIICMLTGLAVLTSGVWKDKHQNDFQVADLTALVGRYDDRVDADRERLSAHMTGKESLPLFTGELKVTEGRLAGDVTIIHARSEAEDVLVTRNRQPYDGVLRFNNRS